MNNQLDIDKIYLYAKDPFEAKYQYLVDKHENVGLNHHDDHKTYKKNEEYNLGKT